MNILQIAAQIALILTLIVVGWYTWETHLLRRLQVRPALIVTVDLDANLLFIRNVGTSAALNIEIPDFEGLSILISADPNWLDSLENGQQRESRLHSVTRKWTGMAFTAIMSDDPLRILLRYQDIDGTHYETQTQVTPNFTKIVYTRRVRFWSKWS